MTDDWQTPTFYEYGLLQRHHLKSGPAVCPSKAKVTRSNRAGRAISERYRHQMPPITRCKPSSCIRRIARLTIPANYDDRAPIKCTVIAIPPNYCAGADIGRMLDTLQPLGVLTRI